MDTTQTAAGNTVFVVEHFIYTDRCIVDGQAKEGEEVSLEHLLLSWHPPKNESNSPSNVFRVAFRVV